MASDSNGAKKFKEYGIYNYDELILFAPMADGRIMLVGKFFFLTKKKNNLVSKILLEFPSLTC